jgi:SAM-dependent methyltransferase
MKLSELFISNKNVELLVLQDKLLNFYKTNNAYTAYVEESNHDLQWDSIIELINVKYKRNDQIKILEIGAGKSGFYHKLKFILPNYKYYTHDITEQNKEHLLNNSDKAIIGDINNIKENFDIIFSTYVFEHIANPEESLNHLVTMLNNDGSLIIFSPRYDFPFYISPSAKHYSIKKRIFISFWLYFFKIKMGLKRKSFFLIHKDPAVLYKKWATDYDAIHWVSFSLLKTYCKQNNLKIKNIDLKSNRYMLLRVIISK